MADLSARSILAGTASGPIIAAGEALSFWGGVDPATGRVIDVHHPLHGATITSFRTPAGQELLFTSSRAIYDGACCGNGGIAQSACTDAAFCARVLPTIRTLAASLVSAMRALLPAL